MPTTLLFPVGFLFTPTCYRLKIRYGWRAYRCLRAPMVFAKSKQKPAIIFFLASPLTGISLRFISLPYNHRPGSMPLLFFFYRSLFSFRSSTYIRAEALTYVRSRTVLESSGLWRCWQLSIFFPNHPLGLYSHP